MTTPTIHIARGRLCRRRCTCWLPGISCRVPGSSRLSTSPSRSGGASGRSGSTGGGGGPRWVRRLGAGGPGLTAFPPGVRFRLRRELNGRRVADGELKVRLREGIEGKIREGGERRALYSQALESIDRATVTTIHAFAASLLRERPVEAGIDPRFRVFDALESQILKDEVFDSFWSESLQIRDPDLGPALHLGVGRERVRTLADFAVENRDVDPPLAPPPAAASSDFAARSA